MDTETHGWETWEWDASLFAGAARYYEKDMRKILAQASPTGRFSVRLPDNRLRIWRLPA